MTVATSRSLSRKESDLIDVPERPSGEPHGSRRNGPLTEDLRSMRYSGVITRIEALVASM
jgi:hypothetical protein